MALEMKYEWKGLVFDKAYFKIGETALNKVASEAIVTVYVYANQEARQQDVMNYFETKVYATDGESFDRFFSEDALKEKSIVQASYEFLKSLPEFENAVDA